MPSPSLVSLILPLLLQHILPISTSTCASPATYPSILQSLKIPYRNANSNPTLAWDMSFDFTISTTLTSGSYPLHASMDPGSTGVAIGATLMNLTLDDVKGFEKGAEYLSGGATWEGHWVPAEKVNITFDGGKSVTAKVPVLAVTEKSICDKGCKNKTNVTEMPDDVQYLGVGYGRYSTKNPHATPDKNPLTNIAYIDNAPIPPNTLHSGYIITLAGVEVGLTPSNTASFHTTQLSPLPGSQTTGRT